VGAQDRRLCIRSRPPSVGQKCGAQKAAVLQHAAASRLPSGGFPTPNGIAEHVPVDGQPTDLPYSVCPRRPTGYGRATANRDTDPIDAHSRCCRVRPGDRGHRRARFTLVQLLKGADVQLERSVPRVEALDRRRSAAFPQCIGVDAPPPHVSVRTRAAGITPRPWHAPAEVEAWSATETGGVNADGDGAHSTVRGRDRTRATSGRNAGRGIRKSSAHAVGSTSGGGSAESMRAGCG
jgi:hypothetical protein